MLDSLEGKQHQKNILGIRDVRDNTRLARINREFQINLNAETTQVLVPSVFSSLH